MYVPREMKSRFHRIDDHYNIIAVVGARQSGKTTFLKQQMEGKSATYVLFDDPDARDMFDSDIKKFEAEYIEGRRLTVLDEVQYCEGAGGKLKYLADMGRKLWITSSSEILLAKEIISYLVGRISILKMYPFSLPEFIDAKGRKSTTATILERDIWEHISYGGYPKVVTTSDTDMKRIILRDLYETMLLKDMARTFSIEDSRALERCVRYLAVNSGGIISYREICNVVNISFKTVTKYIDAMEKSYLVISVTPFFTNKTKEISKQPKIYFLDTGLRNVIAKRFQAEPDGRMFENYVLSEIVKTGFSPKYWRTKAKTEVDFVVEADNCVIPIEVKLNASPPRIEKSLRSFINRYGPEEAVIVTYKGTHGEMSLKGCRVRYTDVMGLRKILMQNQ